MDCEAAIFGRRSIRRYQTKSIPEEDLRAILDAGLAAPSAVNYQPWFLVAVQSPHMLSQLIEITARAAAEIEPGLTKRFQNHPEVVAETCAFTRTLGNSPVCILAFQEKAEYAKSRSSIHQSIAASLENICLSAWSRGIGSCWITAPLEAGLGEEIRTAFAPDKGELVAMLTLGYPERIPTAPRRKAGRLQIL